jgi:hypothetical protein
MWITSTIYSDKNIKSGVNTGITPLFYVKLRACIFKEINVECAYKW